jgi:methionine biosynthesis protein MetW
MQQKDPYDLANVTILGFVEEFTVSEQTQVLDVGCWKGALGAELIARYNCLVDGVDFDSDSLDTAVSRGYRNAFQIDLDQLDISKLEKNKYDIIVFGDVLEHTRDAASVLVKMLPLLRRGGQIIVSLPNIGFLYFRLTHLLGKWEYKESGVMDRTHLRFFTKDTMNEMFNSSGLRVLDQKGFVGLKNYRAFIRIPLLWLAKIWPSLFAIQIITRLEGT